MTLTPQVDVEEMKRQLRRELLVDLNPILEFQRIQFHDIVGVMSKEECRSSLASTATSAITIEPTDQVPIGDGRPQRGASGHSIWTHRGPRATTTFIRAGYNR
jgi:hypothetical protein